MLSKYDLKNGTTFVLKLSDAASLPALWVERLCGDVATYWYEVYRKSDWEALRTRGAQVFRHRVTEAEAEGVRRSERCVLIQTPAVKAEELDPPPKRPKPLQPGWENEGGSLAPIVPPADNLTDCNSPVAQDGGTA